MVMSTWDLGVWEPHLGSRGILASEKRGGRSPSSFLPLAVVSSAFEIHPLHSRLISAASRAEQNGRLPQTLWRAAPPLLILPPQPPTRPPLAAAADLSSSSSQHPLGLALCLLSFSPRGIGGTSEGLITPELESMGAGA